MSISSISRSNVLSYDVLLMIFQQLDGEDLVNCEAVCRQWRDVLLAGTPWRRLFHRKVNYSHLWRKEQKKLEKNQVTLRTDKYRDVCRNLLQVKRNWCTGRFEKSVYSLDEQGVNHGWLWNMTINDDYVAWEVLDYDHAEVSTGFFWDNESNEITKFPSVKKHQCFNEMEVRFAYSTKSGTPDTIIVRDPKNQWTVHVGDAEENGHGNSACRNMFFGSQLLVKITYLYNGTERMRMWKVGNSPTLIHDRTLEVHDLRIVKVDEQFIVAKVNERLSHFWVNGRILYFFSTETLDEFTSLSVNNIECAYDRGLLFQSLGKRIRVLDVATGTHFNDVRLPLTPCILLVDKWASSNSNVMAIGWLNKKNSETWSHVSVYNLEAVKKPNSDPGSHLLYTLQFQYNIHSLVMDETRIALIGSNYTSKLTTGTKQSMTVLNFANFNFAERKSFDLKKNPEDNEDFKMKIIFDP